MSLRARIYNIMQYEKHPTTGEILLTEDTIKKALAHDTIKQYAYIRHDKDTYSEKDEKDDPTHKKGEYKPPHWHIVLQMKTNSTELPTVARWFGISDNYVDMPKGRGAFLDCVNYLTHEDEKQQEQGKALYDNNCVQANFDWQGELDKRDELRLKFGKKGDNLTDKQKMGQRIMIDGLTLRQAKKEDPLLFADNLEFFRKMRSVYLSDAKPPRARLNYYICGDAGAGKGVMSRALARSMYPDLIEDEEIFFEVGAANALFEGYDGQPVLIWNDRRAGNLIKELGGRGNVYNVFDTHPTRQKQDVKFSSVGLVNAVNIVNSVQPYIEFLETLAGVKKDDETDSANEYEQKSQSYRRFPLIINVHPDEFDIYINKGFLSQDESYEEYEAHKHLYGSMRKLAERCSQYEGMRRNLEQKAMRVIVEQHERLKSYGEIEGEPLPPDAIEAEFNYGWQKLDLSRTEEELAAKRAIHEKRQRARELAEAKKILHDEFEAWKKEYLQSSDYLFSDECPFGDRDEDLFPTFYKEYMAVNHGIK